MFNHDGFICFLQRSKCSVFVHVAQIGGFAHFQCLFTTSIIPASNHSHVLLTVPAAKALTMRLHNHLRLDSIQKSHTGGIVGMAAGNGVQLGNCFASSFAVLALLSQIQKNIVLGSKKDAHDLLSAHPPTNHRKEVFVTSHERLWGGTFFQRPLRTGFIGEGFR